MTTKIIINVPETETPISDAGISNTPTMAVNAATLAINTAASTLEKPQHSESLGYSPSDAEALLKRAKALSLHGMVAHWSEISYTDWIRDLLQWEETERSHRSLERRLRCSHLGRFKPLAQFDWNWPRQCDREAIEECMQLNFIKEPTNIVLCGPNGVGKSMIAKNMAYQAAISGHTVLFTTAAEMLNDLASQDGDGALRRRFKYYVQPTLVVVDEVGYLSYSSRCADLFFEIISRRYHEKPTIITTNKPFAEWGEVFPHASCVVSLIDRLVHCSEIISIDADSFRLKEAEERSAKRNEVRAKNKGKQNNQITEDKKCQKI